MSGRATGSSLPVRLLFLLVALTGLTFLTAARKPPRSDDQVLIDLLVRQRPRWPEAYAELLVERMPERVFHALRHQSQGTISSYVIHRRLPQRVGSGPIVCWASPGHGGGYMLLLDRPGDGYTAVWDSLMPVSVIAPELEFHDLDGDGGNEIIISGELLEGGQKEWGIVHWNGDGSWVMAPRLDVPGKHRTYNRLIGRALTIGPPDSAGLCALRLHAPMPAAAETGPDSVRVFVYDSTLRGFLPAALSKQ